MHLAAATLFGRVASTGAYASNALAVCLLVLFFENLTLAVEIPFISYTCPRKRTSPFIVIHWTTIVSKSAVGLDRRMECLAIVSIKATSLIQYLK